MSKKTLSLDLRERVVTAVAGRHVPPAGGGTFWRLRGKRCSVVSQAKETGSPASYHNGGDGRWSARIDAHND